MTARRIGAAVLVAFAWLMAIGAGVLLWGHAAWLRYYLLCWPMNAGAGRWHTELTGTYALLALDLALPAAATLCTRKHPNIAAVIAAAQIVLMPIAFTWLERWNTVTP
jgi:hypothetical protein